MASHGDPKIENGGGPLVSKPAGSWWSTRAFWLAAAAGPFYWLGHWLLIGGGDGPTFELQFWMLVLAYPVLEECVFRGLAQGQMLRVQALQCQWMGFSIANAIASALFALSHLAVRGEVDALAVFLPSLLFGYFFERHRSLAPAISLHIFYNAGFFTLLA